MDGSFHGKLKVKIHLFITTIYTLVKKFPKEERYGLMSQICRASISIMLNYVEGYARRKPKVKINFYEISHGSTQECKYIIFFAYTQQWITKAEYEKTLDIVNEVARMLWSTIDLLEKEIE